MWLAAGNGGDGPEFHGHSVIVSELAVQGRRQGEGLGVGQVVIPVEYGEDLLEGPGLDVLVAISVLKQFPRVSDDLNRGRAEVAWLDLDVGRMKTELPADFVEVVGLGLAPFGDDEDAVVAGSPTKLAFKLLPLAFLGSRYP